MDQAKLDHRVHRREFVGDARKAVALFGEFRLVLRVPGVDELTARLADQYLAGVISILFHALRRDDADVAACLQLNLDAKAEPILLAEVSLGEGFPELFRQLSLFSPSTIRALCATMMNREKRYAGSGRIRQFLWQEDMHSINPRSSEV